MRLTPVEIREFREEMSSWHSPTAMIARAEQVIGVLGDSDFFNQPGLSFVREAWVGGMFGRVRGAEGIRLIASDRPDIALRYSDSREEGYEIAEADVPRARGRKYRGAESNNLRVGDGPVGHWAAATEAFDAIRKVAEKKRLKALQLEQASTPYPPGTSLLIYLNVSDYGAHQQEIESTFQEAVTPVKDRFASVWILWKLRAYCL